MSAAKRGPKPKPALERLEDRSSSLPNGCRIWHGIRNEKGYGIIRYEHKNWLAHRLSFFVANGPFRAEDCVLHKCDTPACINPDHLFLGDRRTNNADMLAKGRHVPQRNGKPPKFAGDNHPQAKLTWNDVRAIRASDKSSSDLAKVYGMSPSGIRCIKSGRTWKE